MISRKFTLTLNEVERADKKLVLDGEYLENTQVTWLNPSEVTLCMPNGLTDSFRNYVTLTVGDGASETIRTHLQEHCPSLAQSFDGSLKDNVITDSQHPILRRKP